MLNLTPQEREKIFFGESCLGLCHIAKFIVLLKGVHTATGREEAEAQRKVVSELYDLTKENTEIRKVLEVEKDTLDGAKAAPFDLDSLKNYEILRAMRKVVTELYDLTKENIETRKALKTIKDLLQAAQKRFFPELEF